MMREREKMKAAGFSKMLVIANQTTWYQNTGNYNLNSHSNEKL
jgi:hypothetical protein